MTEFRRPFLETPIEYLKGVGPARAELFQKELDIHRFGDLLNHFPYRYVDRGRFFKVSDLRHITYPVQLKGVIYNLQEIRQKRGSRLTALFKDESGVLELVWFKGVKWLKDSLIQNHSYVIYGKPTVFKGKLNLAHPELESWEQYKLKKETGLRALYSTTEKMKLKNLDSKAIHKVMSNLILQLPPGSIYENLPDWVVDKYRLIKREKAMTLIHRPNTHEDYRQALRRLKFEELFFIQLQILKLKLNHQKNKGLTFSEPSRHRSTLINDVLTFNLTRAQERVIHEIDADMQSGLQMNRLLQGDVGSGKTIVALCAMLKAIDNGHQCAMMAPTEILAQQHFNNLKEMADKMGLRIALLTGSVKGKVRKQLLQALTEGYLDILIGTHAIIESKVAFKKLGFIVIDEQHRFGVEQRSKLWEKSEYLPHILVMTATPIPRTLAMTLYGDLDVSVIDELPPGRKPVKTIHRYESARLSIFGFMKEQIKEGRQVYVVYPLIAESEKMDLNNLMTGYEAIERVFPKPDYQVSVVHGKMKARDKDMEMQRFVKGETHIMVATTVIEVGVNVPNATVMIIENAERFGLSQLHQLRGRVGRGGDQSYCILISDYKISNDGLKRLRTMVETNDGFRISEVDLELRGPGDIAGTRQSGLMSGLKLANLAMDGIILEEARKTASSTLQEDPELDMAKNAGTRRFALDSLEQGSYWSMIS